MAVTRTDARKAARGGRGAGPSANATAKKATGTKRAAPPKSSKTVPAGKLVISLSDPGMTPLFRAGLGGLAASLFAIAGGKEPAWPNSIPLDGGTARVDAQAITISWSGGKRHDLLVDLCRRSFRLENHRVDLPGTRSERPNNVIVAALLQQALQRTILQFNKHVKPADKNAVVSSVIDDNRFQVACPTLESYLHKEQGADLVEKALARGSVELAGWAHPGAAQRHVRAKATACAYPPGLAISALFAVVGCVAYLAPNQHGGILLVPEPADLQVFGATRHRLTPETPRDEFVASGADAVLNAELALRTTGTKAGKAATTFGAVVMRTLPWAKQQKTRSAVLEPSAMPEAVLDAYADAMSLLPPRFIVKKDRDADDEDDAGEAFFRPNWLRGFIADNIAAGRKWYAGFAAARTDEKKPRLLHRPYSKGNNGALHREDLEALRKMNERLPEDEKSFVKSIHCALARRFGAIHDEVGGNKVVLQKRFEKESDHWRYAFSGAKTQSRLRAAVCDLWSRAGSNKVLQESWNDVLPLLGPGRWEAARDLALLALASYKGKDRQEDATQETE